MKAKKAIGGAHDRHLAMMVKKIKGLVERQPFRPFAVRLNNGARYRFREPRDVGAPKAYNFIFYFGQEDSVLIETASIVEVFE